MSNPTKRTGLACAARTSHATSTRSHLGPTRQHAGVAAALLGLGTLVGLDPAFGCTPKQNGDTRPLPASENEAPSASTSSPPRTPRTLGLKESGRLQPKLRQAQFPVGISPNKRYLVDATGAPFLIRGDTAWSAIAQLSKADALTYLDSRRAHGFNTILVNLIEANFSSHDPKWRNAEGQVPFADPDDFSKPNTRYFDHAAWFLAEAEQRGLLVLLAPAYLGYGCGSEGWCTRLKQNGVDKLRLYGHYVGERFQLSKNILWVQGGDHTPSTKGFPSELELVSAIVNGIRDAEGDIHLDAAHWTTEVSGFAGPKVSWLQLDTTYSYAGAKLYTKTLWDRGRNAGLRPFFFLEGLYENEHSVSGVALRAQMYQPVLSGAAGFVFGNFPLWAFWDPSWGWKWKYEDGRYPAGWKSALDGSGTKFASIAFEFFEGLPWQTLSPDTQHKVLIEGFGSGESYALCATDPSRRLAVTYLTDSLTLRFDLSAFPKRISAQWLDPTSGVFFDASKEQWPNTGTKRIASPGANSSGSKDWVLVLKSG